MPDKAPDKTIAMRLLVIGADHKSSTMMVRDRLFMRESALPAFYDRLRGVGFTEAMVISTHDRTDILVLDTGIADAAEEIRRLLAAHAGVARSEIASETYMLEGRDAVKHVFAVASALDSLVVGDPRVQDHVRWAHAFATRRGMIGHWLAELMDRAFALAEQIDRETDLARRPSSIPAAAAYVARDLHGDLARCSALLIGTGEMGELLASALVAAGVEHLVVTHPAPARAEAAAHTLNCHAGDFGDLAKLVASADIVIASMNTRRYVLERDLVRRAVMERRRKPIFVVDTGVPGDVDPSVAQVEDAFVYTLDDLERVTRLSARGHEQGPNSTLGRAWALVGDAVTEFAGRADEPKDGSGSDANALENLRRESLRLAGGDADKATRFLVERLLRLKRDR
jgi:glutamyl-tRNA reductase